MLFLHCWCLVLSIIAVNGITGQYYAQPNNQYYGNRGNYNNRNFNGYGGSYNNIYKSSYDNTVDRNVVRLDEAAVRPGELMVEINENQGQTPCRNKGANKNHKETLWWTLPIPPMELEGPPEKPPQIKQESYQSVEKAPPSQGGGYETGAIQQKHPAPAAPPVAATTPKAQQPAAPTQAVVQVATTQASKHEAATTQAAKQKVAQMQKQAASSGAATNQGQQAQQNAPVPSQLVVSNKESGNMQMIANKSVATMKVPSANNRMNVPVMPHGLNKQKVMQNRMEPALYQYGDTMPQAYANYPYLNSPYLRDSQIAPNRGYNRADAMQESIAELADSMYKEFDTNDAELGGGGVIGENSAYSREGHQNMLQSDNSAPYQHQEPANQWNLPDDERNKRNLQKTAVIS